MYYIACPFNGRLSTGPWRRFLLSLESNVVDGHFSPFEPFTASALFSSIPWQLYFAPFSLLAISSRPGFFCDKISFLPLCRRSIFQRCRGNISTTQLRFLCFPAKISFLLLPYQGFLLFRRRLYIFAYNIVVYNRQGRFRDNFYKDRNVHGIFLASLRFLRIQIIRRDKENSEKLARAGLVQLDERMLEITQIIRSSCLSKIVKRESIISRFITCQRTDIIRR